MEIKKKNEIFEKKRKHDKENYAKIIGSPEYKKVKAKQESSINFTWITSGNHRSVR